MNTSLFTFCGALTSKPYAFTARPWELRSAQAIDWLDGVGNSIRVDFKETEIVRVLPRKNPEVNENWISDKIRFFYDALHRQRLKTPYLKNKGNLEKAKWAKTLHTLASVLRVYSYEYGNSSIGLLTGASVDSETLLAIREFVNAFGFSNLGMDQDSNVNLDNPTQYRWNGQFRDLETADFCLLIGTNPRYEASTLNLRLRKIFRQGTIEFASIGANFSTTFPIQHIGLTSKVLVSLVEGTNPLCKKLARAKNPVIICGSNLLKRHDSLGLLTALKSLARSILHENALHVLHNNANSVGGFEIGFSGIKKEELKRMKLVYCIQTSLEGSNSILPNSLVVLQHSHGNHSTKNADFVLPSPTFVEKTGTYFNTEARPQKSHGVFVPSSLVREDWKILQALSYHLNKSLSFGTKGSLSSNLSKILPSSSYPSVWLSWNEKASSSCFSFVSNQKEKILKSSFSLPIEDFYMTPRICRFSKVMAKASEALRVSSTNYRFLSIGK